MAARAWLQICTNIEIFMPHTFLSTHTHIHRHTYWGEDCRFMPASFRNAILISSAQQATAKQHPFSVSNDASVTIIVVRFVSACCAIISAAHFLTPPPPCSPIAFFSISPILPLISLCCLSCTLCLCVAFCLPLWLPNISIVWHPLKLIRLNQPRAPAEMPAYKSLHLKSTRRQLDLVSIHLAYLRATHTRTQTQHKLRLATSNNASSFATGSKSLRQYAASNAERTNRPSEKPNAPNLHTAASGEATRPPAHMLHYAHMWSWKCSHKEISLLPRLHANEACKMSM